MSNVGKRGPDKRQRYSKKLGLNPKRPKTTVKVGSSSREIRVFMRWHEPAKSYFGGYPNGLFDEFSKSTRLSVEEATALRDSLTAAIARVSGTGEL